MMRAAQIILWIARIAGTVALLLGLLYWIAGINLVAFHMLCGLILALSFLTLSVMMVFARGMRLLGAIGIVYALILPIFGLTQSSLLTGDLHWLIRLAHLLVGLGALALIDSTFTRYQRLKGLNTARGEYQTASKGKV